MPDDLAIKMAIATSMATIMFTSLSSLRAHHRRGAVRWDLVRGIAPGIVAGGLLAGAGVFALIKGPQLAFVFAAVRRLLGLQMLRNRQPRPSRQMPGPAGPGARWAASSACCRACSAPAAPSSPAPFMTWCNVPMHQVVATSAALGFPVALASTAGLPDQRLEPAQRAARRLRLPVPAGAC